MPKPPSTKPSYFYVITSVTIVLFLLGLFGLVAVLGKQLVKMYKEQVEIIVEIKEDTPAMGIDSLKRYLDGSNFTKPNSIRFISKEEGAELMKEEFGEEFLKLDMPNPLYDVITFNVKSDYLEQDSLMAMKAGLKEIGHVYDVYYQEGITDVITSNLKKVSYFILAAGLFFVIIAVALILNTIRLALYANRFVIKNMELVGASWEFISRPYLIRSLKHGILSALLACGVLAAILYYGTNESPDFNEMVVLPEVGAIFGALIVLGVVISVSCSFYVVKKYLKMRVDDLY